MTSTITRIPALARAAAWLRRIDAPVLVQEMRVRQRGTKPFGVMLAYLLILSVAGMLELYYEWPSTVTVSRMARLGRDLYGVLSMVQLVMVCLIVPAYSSASVCGERERGTLDLLSLTLLSSSSIVTQKLIAAMGQALMLIFASLPIMAIVFLLGGVSPVELLVAYALLLVTAVFLASMGMLCSCCLRSSKGSTFLTYLIMFSLFLGLPLGSAWLESMSRMSGYSSYRDPSFVLFAIVFLFVGAAGSVLVYATLSLFMYNRPMWRVRAFRMSVFGAVYAILLFIVTCPWATDVLLSSSSYNDVPLTFYINPFAALGFYMESHTGYTPVSTSYWMIAATVVFSMGCTFLFRFASSARFAGLRRQQ